MPEPDRPYLMPDRPKVIGANTYNEVQKQLAGIGDIHGMPLPNGMPPGALPPPPPPPMFIPHQVRPAQSRNRKLFLQFLFKS